MEEVSEAIKGPTDRNADVVLEDGKEGTKLTIKGGTFSEVKDGNKPIVITSGEPVNDNDIVLKDKGAGQTVEDFKVMLMWDKKDGSFDVWNRSKKAVAVMDPFGITPTASIAENAKSKYSFGDRIEVGGHTIAIDTRNMTQSEPSVAIAFARTAAIGSEPVKWDKKS